MNNNKYNNKILVIIKSMNIELNNNKKMKYFHKIIIIRIMIQ